MCKLRCWRPFRALIAEHHSSLRANFTDHEAEPRGLEVTIYTQDRDMQ